MVKSKFILLFLFILILIGNLSYAWDVDQGYHQIQCPSGASNLKLYPYHQGMTQDSLPCDSRRLKKIIPDQNSNYDRVLDDQGNQWWVLKKSLSPKRVVTYDVERYQKAGSWPLKCQGNVHLRQGPSANHHVVKSYYCAGSGHVKVLAKALESGYYQVEIPPHKGWLHPSSFTGGASAEIEPTAASVVRSVLPIHSRYNTSSPSSECSTCDGSRESVSRASVTDTSHLPAILPWGGSSWDPQWTKFLYKQLDSEFLNPILSVPLNEADISRLGCRNYNSLSASQKKKFLIVFIAAIATQESSFNPRASYREAKGSWSLGLLQLGVKNGKAHCGTTYDGRAFSGKETMYDPYANLHCGTRILYNQIKGATGYTKKFKGRLFTGSVGGPYYWSVLNKEKTSKRITKYVRSHSRELPFCKI